MNPNEVLFMAMNIPAEVDKIIRKTFKNATCEGMNGDEYLAYTLGVNNTLNVLRAILNDDEDVVVHLPNINMPTEMDIDEIAEIVEEDCYD